MKPTYEQLLAFVKQMANFTTPEQEYEASEELQAGYEDASDYESDFSDDRLLDEFSLFRDMIETAQEIVKE